MRTVLTLIVIGAGLALPTACSREAAARDPISVTADEHGCVLSRDQIATGRVTFEVVNHGQKVTEFYVYAPGNRVLGEVEDIAPGQSRTLDVAVDGPGDYEVSCRPGMTGKEIRRSFHAGNPA